MTSEFVEGRQFVELTEWDAEYSIEKLRAAFAVPENTNWLDGAMERIHTFTIAAIFKREERVVERDKQAQLF